MCFEAEEVFFALRKTVILSVCILSSGSFVSVMARL